MGGAGRTRTRRTSGSAAAPERVAGVGDEAVKKATGRSWAAWLQALDLEGAHHLGHKGIVALVKSKGNVSSWWQQMVAVGYEQARGLRKQGQTSQGDFQVSVSRTLPVPVSRLYTAWSRKDQRSRWLEHPDLTVRKQTRNRTLRITWKDGVTHVDVHLDVPGSSKSRVTVQHRKLKDRKQVERMRAYWRRNLDALASHLAGAGGARRRS